MSEPQAGVQQARRDVRWLRFDLLGRYRGGQSELAEELQAVTALEQMELQLAATARSNRRAVALFLSGALGSLLVLALWRAFVSGIVFRLNDLGVLSGETQYWIVVGTVWLPFAALIPAALAFTSLPSTFRLAHSLGRAQAVLTSLSVEERQRVVDEVCDSCPRVREVFGSSRKWSRLIAA